MTDNTNKPELTPSEIGKMMRAIPSEKRAETARINGRKPKSRPSGPPRKPIEEYECLCGTFLQREGRHRALCPVSRALKRWEETDQRRASRAKSR